MFFQSFLEEPFLRKSPHIWVDQNIVSVAKVAKNTELVPSPETQVFSLKSLRSQGIQLDDHWTGDFLVTTQPRLVTASFFLLPALHGFTL